MYVYVLVSCSNALILALLYNCMCVVNGDCIIRSEQKMERCTVQEVVDVIDDSDIEAEPETGIDE